MAVTKPSHLSSKMWANTGSVETPDDVKIDSGWGAEVPKSQVENWVQNRQDRAIGHINERGIAEWDASTDYLAGKSYVQDSSGTVYRAVQNTGPSTAPQNPATDIANTYWTVAFSAGELDTYTKAQADERFLHYEENGVNVLDQINGKQDSSPNLNALSSLIGAADRLPYFTGAGALSLTVLTGYARSLLNASSAGEARQTLELGTVAQRNVFAGDAGDVVSTYRIGLTQMALASTPFISDSSPGVHPHVFERANDPSAPDGGTGFWYRQILTYGETGNRTIIAWPYAVAGNTGTIKIRGVYDGQLTPEIELFHTGNQLSLGTTAASARTALGLGTAATWNSVPNASPTAVGGLKARLDGTTLYLTNNGNNA